MIDKFGDQQRLFDGAMVGVCHGGSLKNVQIENLMSRPRNSVLARFGVVLTI